METEFIFWRHATSAGVQIEEICGGEDKSVAIWKRMALQVFGENGGDRFREILHTPSGAPILEDSQQRISVSHTARFMVIAMLPRTPEADLLHYGQRTAMGVDCERSDRAQVLKVADRVLSDDELKLVARYADELSRKGMDAEQARIEATVLAWTIKEALYKAALTEGLDFKVRLPIDALPEICDSPLDQPRVKGTGRLIFPDGTVEQMELFSYKSEGHIVTIAYSPKCAKFKKR